MISQKSAFLWSDRFYTCLLNLYPVEFRLRFGDEMRLFFEDCCGEQIKTGNAIGLFIIWLRAIVDLLRSVPREQGRALLNLGELHSRAGGMVDSIVILAIIGFHLLIAGTGIAMNLPYGRDNFLLVSTASGAALGGLGVLCSVLFSRTRRIHYRYIEV
jgi:hypothetical protein